MALLHYFLLCCLPTVYAIYSLSLNGRWTVFNAAKGISIPGQVPGSMYTALLDNELIPDPMYRDNDVKLAMIGHENWTYSRYFEVSSSMVESSTVVLVVEGIDTIASIFINNNLIGQTDNMFVQYIFDVKSAIKPGNNSISVRFQSAVDYAAKKAANISYIVPPICPLSVQNGECHINMVRKEQCSFSWDWGPSFPTQGIWKPIYLQGFQTAVIEYASVDIYSVGAGWLLLVDVYFLVSSNTLGQVEMRLDGTNITQSVNVTLSGNDRHRVFNISVPSNVGIKPWWPNGYGSQSLYNFYVIFTSAGEVTSRRLRIGFRTVELVQEPVSTDASQGLTFYFRVNGMPIFCKGSNWIPADSFQERLSKARLQNLLQSAADAHINSMRVWGGGVYESEDFYDLADELGIMIWQDLMFSVAMYPTDSEFLQSVTKEVTHQIRRLKHRPSIILWAGSNENEKALRQNWFGTSSNYSLYYHDFVKLYITTIKSVVNIEDPSREYLSSSPSNGIESAKEGYVAQDPDSELYGDIHFYDYFINQWVPDSFRIPRFASEYGIQAWCNYATLLNVFKTEDMSYFSTQAKHRQHRLGGSIEMIFEILHHVNINSTADEVKLFKDLIYLTQINQAMSVKSQSEHYRRYQSTLLPDGRGLTMGALFWQLNDIWQAPTWASIDYSGRWKMLHYYALKFFDKVLISPFMERDDLNIFIVVDEIPIQEIREEFTQRLYFRPVFQDDLPKEDVFGFTDSGWLVIEMYNWNSLSPLKQWVVSYKLKTTAESIFKHSVSDLMSQAGCLNIADCLIYVYLNNTDSTYSNWLSLAELKDSSLRKTHISITNVTQDSDNTFTLTLSTTSIAPFVWLDAGLILGHFSNNGFLMVHPLSTVHFYAWQSVNSDVLRKSLSVVSLLDIYN